MYGANSHIQSIGSRVELVRSILDRSKRGQIQRDELDSTIRHFLLDLCNCVFGFGLCSRSEVDDLGIVLCQL